jgi:hypothetical protein
MYGDDFCDEMLTSSRKPKKYLRADLEDMVKDLRKKNRELEDAI